MEDNHHLSIASASIKAQEGIKSRNEDLYTTLNIWYGWLEEVISQYRKNGILDVEENGTCDRLISDILQLNRTSVMGKTMLLENFKEIPQ